MVRVLLVALGVLLLAGGWLAFRGYQAVTALRDAQEGVSVIADVAREGDFARAEAELPRVQADLARARTAVQDPVWAAASVLPWAGDQLGAVRTVAVSLDDMVTAVAPVVTALDSALTAREQPGAQLADLLAPLVAAAPDIVAAQDDVLAAAAQIAAIDTAALVPQLADAVTRVQDALPAVTSAMDLGGRAARLLPGMLGFDGPRTYLLVSLNPAELRAPGGIPGAFAVLRVEAGALTLVDQRSNTSFPALDEPVLPLTDSEQQLYTDRLGRWVQDAALTPDFPRTAQLLSARWQRESGQTVDGVIATDPVAVAALLAVTGPVTEPSGRTLTADNLVDDLLRDTYLRLADRNDADQYFNDVAATVLGAVVQGAGDDPVALAQAVGHEVGAGRVRVWSAVESEQSELAATQIGGAFLTGPFDDALGVFLDDGTTGKLDYYLSVHVTVQDMTCTGPTPTATVRLDLDYQPPDGVELAPDYVTGVATSGLPPGWLGTNISVYAPVGAPLGSLGYQGGAVGGLSGEAAGRAVQVVTSVLQPGDAASYTATVPLHDGQISVWSTPTLTSDGLTTASCP